MQNAIEYRTGDNPPVITTGEEGNNLVIEIVNDGNLPDPLPLFFEPWSRGDQSRTSGGSGLGLSIVYQIMELHNGTVDITGEDGKVKVTLEFPCLDYVSVV